MKQTSEIGTKALSLDADHVICVKSWVYRFAAVDEHGHHSYLTDGIDVC